MKAKTLPLPTPWTIDAAIFHLYRCWSNQGQTKIHKITLSNPNMVNALWALWLRDEHQQIPGEQPYEEPVGLLAGIGTWRLLQELGGAGVIRIEHLEDG